MAGLLLAIIYLAFISLGLPDALLGSAWPLIYPQFQVPVSYAGIISMIISGGTIFSALQSDRLTHSLGTGKVTAFSVAMTAVALFGFSVSDHFWQLCLWAVPYGLGAGSVDASLNNYMALHYESRHMSWLHCMWGLGASLGPYIMGFALSHQQGWPMGYRYISFLQIALSAVLFFSLPLWKSRITDGEDPEDDHVLSLGEVLKISGVLEIILCFFCYSGVESTTGLWASTYLNLQKGIPAETAASFGAMFYIGIMIGRAICGFITLKLNDIQMIRMGEGIIAAAVLLLFLPGPSALSLAGFALIGLGCAPIFPCLIHSTPDHFGAKQSQAVIGVQMAGAYIGTLSIPPLFGLIAEHISLGLLPVILTLSLVLMTWMHERLIKAAKDSHH
ncbi:MAG: MFS transporter [Erysipelotrichaceae bacterium]|nr:MFS transporter [Erysipelotrichaceae bacterium]